MPTLTHAFPQEAQTRLRRLAVVGQAPGLAERPSAPVTKFEVETTLKDARRVIGLTPAEVMLLDVLMALTPKADWLEGRPLVFASNRTICQRSSFCDRHVSRLLASLEAKGVVLRHYSGNGKRWGLRGADDALVDGRGVDLSPMIARVPAWRQALAEQHAIDAAHAYRARTITERRVRLRETLEAFVGSDVDEKTSLLLADLDQAVPPPLRTTRALRALASNELCELERRLTAIEAEVEGLVDELTFHAEDTNESSRADDFVGPHIRPKNQPDFCSHTSRRANARHTQPSTSLATKKEKKQRTSRSVSVSILQDALPLFWSDFSSFGFTDLHGFVRAAEVARSMIQVDERMWAEAHGALGHNRVLVAMLCAYVFERLRTKGRHGLSDPNSVGGYFRRCVERAAEGKLYLDASLHAAAQRNRKLKAQVDDDLI